MTSFDIKLAPPHLDSDLFHKLASRMSESLEDPGQALRKFESGIVTLIKGKFALCTSSGTAALHLALLSLGIDKNDEVLCPTFTFAATINAISYIGATPIIIDSEAESWNICPDTLREAIIDRIKSGKKPKALLLAHTYGMPARIDEILNICTEYDIKIIEDAAGSLGGQYKDQALGTIGDIGIFSFNYNKIITTAGGGMLISNDKQTRDRAAFLSAQARTPAPFYVHTEVGYNYQMNGLAAELGLAQLHLLASRREKKRKIFDFYRAELSKIQGVNFQNELDGMKSNRWLSTVIFEDPELPELVKNNLAKKRIEVRRLWNPMHLQPVFKHYPYYGGNVAEQLFNHGLALPSGTNITTEDQYFVTQTSQDILKSLMKS